MDELWLQPMVRASFGGKVSAGVGPWLRLSRTDDDDNAYFASIADTLYGAGRFGRMGAAATFELDTRDREISTTSGALVRLRGSVAPPLWSAEEGYASVEGEARTYLTAAGLPGGPTLALRAGGKKVSGRHPFQASAFVGGRDKLRGWSSERFAGDASAHGSAELRVRLTRFTFMVPGHLGLFGLADAARVFVDGDSPGGWHTAVGGGIWLNFVDPARTMTLGFATGEERSAFYLGVGFAY
jgi:outer membrane protein assembly factor BamA